MAFPFWTPDLSVGDRVLDAQHEELFRALNRVGTALRKGEAPATVDRLLGFLVDYLQAHFLEEEKLMAEVHCSDAARHRAAHERLLLQLQGYLLPGGVRVSEQVLVFLRAWMVDHFQKEDRRLAKHAKAWVEAREDVAG